MPNLLPIRLQAYRQALLLDPIEDDSIQARTQLWHTTERHINSLLTLHGSTPNEEADILLTLLVLLQVGIRNHDALQTTIDRAYTLLPQLSDSQLKTRLLTLLYTETEDEDLLPCIEQRMDRLGEGRMTEEDLYLSEIYNTINVL